MWKRALCVFVSFVLVVGLCPAPAFAKVSEGELVAASYAAQQNDSFDSSSGGSSSTVGSINDSIGLLSVDGSTVNNEASSLSNDMQTASSDAIDESASALGLFKYILNHSMVGSAQFIDAQCAIDILSGTTTSGILYPSYQGPTQSSQYSSATNGESNANAYKRVNYTAGDAVSLTNFSTALDMIDSYNSYRAKENNTEGFSLSTTVGMNCRMMAISIVMCDWSKATIAHSRAYDVGENLSWGYSNPFSGWYDDEKATYKSLINSGKSYADFTSAEQSSVGHYLNIVDYAPTKTRSDYPTTVTGFAVCTDGAQYGIAHEQSFYTFGKYYPANISYSTKDFRTQWLTPYEASLQPSSDPDPAPDPDPDPNPNPDPEPEPTGEPCAILYSNGDLVFQRGNTLDEDRGTVSNQWTDAETHFLTQSVRPWGSSATSVKKVVIKNSFAPVSIQAWFSGMFYLTSIEGLNKLDTSKVTSMEDLFKNCLKLTAVDLSNFNTSNVTDMSAMFSNCSALTTLDVSSFNTSNVTDMSNMFGWSTSYTMGNLGLSFYGCKSLVSLDVSNFDTSKVASMSAMFAYCSKLSNLNLSNFNTSNVTDMMYMFKNCSNLTTITLNKESFNTSKVTSMWEMFRECRKLVSVDVSGFNTSNVKSFTYMFWGCNSLKVIDVSNFNTSQATSMASMFAYCNAVETLDVSKFDTSNVTSFSSMFAGCSSVLELNVAGFNTANVTNTESMFYGCKKITSLDVSHFDTSKVTTMYSMFRACSELTALDLSSFNTKSLETGYDNGTGAYILLGTDYLFDNCTKLASLTFGTEFATTGKIDNKYGPNLPAVSSDAPYTGLWVRISDGATAASDALFEHTFAELAGTWTWQRAAIEPVQPIDISDAVVALSRTVYTYDGSEKHPEVVSVKLANGGLVPAESYQVSYSQDCTNAGSYMVTVTATDDAYTGETSGTFTISKASLIGARVVLMQSGYPYDGTEKTPSVQSVTLTTGFSVPSTGYTVSYASGRIESGTYTVTVTGQGNYEGSASTSFEIVAPEKTDISAATVALEWQEMTYNGNRQVPEVVSVTLPSGNTVPKDSYTVLAEDEFTNAGSYYISVSGIGNYVGSASAGFTISKREITTDMISEIADQPFSGVAIKPDVSVSFAGKPLTSDDYSVFYTNNTAIGTANVNVIARETSANFSGSATVTFNIVRTQGEFKAARDAWRFENDGYSLDLSYFQDFYGDSYGYQMWRSLSGTGGVCYGMSAAAFASSAYSRPTVSSWTNGSRSAQSLNDVGKEWKSPETAIWTKRGQNLTALDYIKYAFIAQVDPKMSNQYRENLKTLSNISGLSKLVEAINAATQGTGELPVIGIYPDRRGGHAISPLRMGESYPAEGNKPARNEVIIYDCNHPNEERSLWLFKNEQGQYTGWEYDLGWNTVWGTTQNGAARITWEYPSKELENMFNRKGKFDLKSYEDSLSRTKLYRTNTNVTVVSSGKEFELSPEAADGNNIEYVPIMGFSPEAERDADDLYWTNLSDEVSFTDITEDARIGIASDEGGVNMQVEAGSEATVRVVDNSSNSVAIKQNEGAEFEIEFFGDDLQEGKESQTLTVKGTGNEYITTRQVDSDVLVSGVISLEAEGMGGSVKENNLNPNASYTISATTSTSGNLSVTENKVAKPRANNFEFDGMQKTGVVRAEGYELTGTTSATNAGTYTVTAVLKDGWKWSDGSSDSYMLSWKITPTSISEAQISLSQSSYVYDGKAKTPSVTVKLGSLTLQTSSDYQITYIANTSAGQAKVQVKGIGNYKDTVEKAFTITPTSISEAQISLSQSSYVYDGKAKTPSVTVKLGSLTLQTSSDYQITYITNTSAGQAKVRIEGKGNFKDFAEKAFTITKAPNSLKMKGKSITAKLKTLKKKSVKFGTAKVYKFTSKGQGTLTYTRVKKGSSKYLSVNKKTGAVTVKRGASKKNHTIKVQVKAAGNKNYQSAVQTITVKVKVK